VVAEAGLGIVQLYEGRKEEGEKGGKQEENKRQVWLAA
jgi:hypothetical protein